MKQEEVKLLILNRFEEILNYGEIYVRHVYRTIWDECRPNLDE